VRGFRFLGRAEHVSVRDYNESDLLFFSPFEDGSLMRAGGIRARDFDLFSCQTAIATGACISDFVFVATALGEDCFRPASDEQ
jgi:hypothetical protein